MPKHRTGKQRRRTVAEIAARLQNEDAPPVVVQPVIAPQHTDTIAITKEPVPG